MTESFSKTANLGELENLSIVGESVCESCENPGDNVTDELSDNQRVEKITDGEWIKLVSFGQYDHPKGLQLVDCDSAKAMINYFNSLRGKFMRRFVGLPIYVGHPDDPEYEGNQDRSIYGRVESIKIESGALWVLSRWTELGRKLFTSGFLRYLSPRWLMRKIRDRIFQPVRLISIGMTNHPNLCKGESSFAIESAQLIGNKGDVNEICIKKGIAGENLGNPMQIGDFGKELLAECSANQADANNNFAENDTALIGEYATENSSRHGASAENLHVSSLTENLFERTHCQPCRDRILALVYEQMANFGDDYQTAWNSVKRKFPALFGENFNLK
ncbi:MAG: phage protease [Puniceicoccales bacterium]|jgi:hypothetical protein|nr:phage protease [Puniceicoccales bacterium]